MKHKSTAALRRLTFRTLAIFILLPTTLGAGLFGLMALAQAWSFFFSANATESHEAFAHGAMLAVTLASWVGIASAWTLYYHFLSSDRAPAKPWLAAAGLACGMASAATLLYATSGPLAARLLTFGSPLLSVAVLALLLARAVSRGIPPADSP